MSKWAIFMSILSNSLHSNIFYISFILNMLENTVRAYGNTEFARRYYIFIILVIIQRNRFKCNNRNRGRPRTAAFDKAEFFFNWKTTGPVLKRLVFNWEWICFSIFPGRINVCISSTLLNGIRNLHNIHMKIYTQK